MISSGKKNKQTSLIADHFSPYKKNRNETKRNQKFAFAFKGG